MQNNISMKKLIKSRNTYKQIHSVASATVQTRYFYHVKRAQSQRMKRREMPETHWKRRLERKLPIIGSDPAKTMSQNNSYLITFLMIGSHLG